MSSTHKIFALRSLATKVALGLGIALVASSIAPMAVAPASATGNDVIYTAGMGQLRAYEVGGVAGHQGTVVGQAPTDNYLVSDGVHIFGAGVNGLDIFPITGGLAGTAFAPSPAIYFNGYNNVKIDSGYLYVRACSVAMCGGTFSIVRTSLASVSASSTWETVVSGLTSLDAFAVSGNDLYYATYAHSGGTYSGTIHKHVIGTQAADVDLGTAYSATQAQQVSIDSMVLLGTDLVYTVSDNAYMGALGYTGPGGVHVASVSGAWAPSTATLDSTAGGRYDLPVVFNGTLYASVLAGGSRGVRAITVTSNSSTSGASLADQMMYGPFVVSSTGASAWAPAPNHTQSFNVNGGSGSVAPITNNTSFTFPSATHADNTCTMLGWSLNQTATIQTANVGSSRPNLNDATWYAVWSSASCRTSQQQNNAPAQPAPELDLSSLKTIPAPTSGVTGGVAGIDLKGKNLPTVASVTVAGKDGKVVTSTDTALKLDLPTMAPGSYDIVMKTSGGGSITIQNGLVVAPAVDSTPVKPVVITPSVPRTVLVAATAPVPGFLPGKATVSEAQKAIIQDVVLTKNVTSLECVGVTNAKVSAKLASARAASICAAAKAQNADLTTSVKTIAEAKVNGPIGSVLINYNH